MANKYYILKCFTKGLKEKTVSGQLPPGFLPPPLKIAPEDKCSTDNCPSGKLPPGKNAPWQLLSVWLLLENHFKGNCPLTKSPWKLPFRWFVAYICHPRKTAPRNIVPRINYTWYIFSPRIRNHSTSVNSCFLLFSFLWFKSVLDFDFSTRKNFIKTVRLKLLKNKEQVKSKILKYWV